MNAKDKETTVRRSGRILKPNQMYNDGVAKEVEKSTKTKRIAKRNRNCGVVVEEKAVKSTKSKKDVNAPKTVENDNEEAATNICRKRKKKTLRGGFRKQFHIDCTKAFNSVNIDGFKTYLQEKLKVNGHINNGRNIVVERQDMNILVNSILRMKKKDLKLMTKKYLKKQKKYNSIKIRANASNSFELYVKN